MEIKNYKAFAKIIKKHFKLNISDVVIYDFIDYFEKEDKKQPDFMITLWQSYGGRKQFLKDVGIKE